MPKPKQQAIKVKKIKKAVKKKPKPRKGGY